MTHGSLFSGIGGFDLAAQWMGWTNVFHCEWNPFGQKILHHYWPNAIQYHDITKTDFSIHRGTIDILTGGFPCQPYSMAGKRLGKEDERHLWPEMLRAIREIQPRWVVGENVLGLVNWSGGLVFHEVQADLEAEGYEVQSFVLPAAAVNAPHRRDRVWFVAYAKSNDHRKQRGKDNGRGKNVSRRETKIWIESARHGESGFASDSDSSTTRTSGEGEGIESEGSSVIFQQSERRSETEQHHRPSAFPRDAADSERVRLQGRSEAGDIQGEKRKASGEGRESPISSKADGEGWVSADPDGIRGRQNERFRNGESNVIDKNGQATDWQTFPTVSPICHGDDGLSDRLDNITFSKWRQESIKGGGNAVVPQVVLRIFETIEEYENL